MKYIIGYSLPYKHNVEVGIEADSPEQAIERATELFDAAEIWDDTPECPLLMDDYDEDVDAGAALVFEAAQTIEDGRPYPEPDGSVHQLRRNDNARAAAVILVTAYRNGEANGGSIDWSDLDAAYELALQPCRSRSQPDHPRMAELF